MRTKALLSLLICLIHALPALAQNWRTTPYEIYGGIALANYFGDIGGSSADNTWYGIRDLRIDRTRPGITGGIRYISGNYLAYNASFTSGWLSGSDRGGRNEGREYIFNTLIFEPCAKVEFYPIRDHRMRRGVDRHGMVKNYAAISAYFYGGLGAVFYHVMPNENLSSRQGTDNIRHSPVTMIFPAGFGIKAGINNRTDIGLEIGGRYAFNDFLDGFTNEISSSNDIYYLTSFQMIYRLSSLQAW
jgi:hypothetical protein